MIKKAILIFLLCAFGSTGFAQNQKHLDYVDKVIEHQTIQNSKMLDSAASPLKQEDRVNFKGLNYFSINPEYNVKCKFKEDIGAWFDMATSTGDVRKYRKFGELKFKLKGEKFTLNLYQSSDLMQMPMYKNYLFVPFTDNTNGTSSYGAGRYIDFRIPSKKKVWIDFNLCYNPYCAYSDKYSCPIPPKENYLNTDIEAGEKVFKP